MRNPLGKILLLFLLIPALALFVWHGFPLEQPALAPALTGVTLVIDPGHGGADAGVTGTNGAPEDDINLAISKKLAEYCRRAGAEVILTRETEDALCEGKRSDLQARVEKAQAEEGDIFISLHCNSYVGDSSQHGAQVFYEKGNTEGEQLANILQNRLQQDLGNTERVALPHPSSYLLQHLSQPAVIVEMGFLTNAEEEALLQQEEYQWQIALSLYIGLWEYRNGTELTSENGATEEN